MLDNDVEAILSMGYDAADERLLLLEAPGYDRDDSAASSAEETRFVSVDWSGHVPTHGSLQRSTTGPLDYRLLSGSFIADTGSGARVMGIRFEELTSVPYEALGELL